MFFNITFTNCGTFHIIFSIFVIVGFMPCELYILISSFHICLRLALSVLNPLVITGGDDRYFHDYYANK